MTTRTYKVPLDGLITVHVHESEGRVEVEAYLGGLGELLKEDPRAPYGETEIQQDIEQVQRVLMASPANHTLRMVLEE